MLKKSILVLALMLPFVYSCKKEGCTDSTALNYSSSAKKDDGSCITEQDIKNTNPQNLYVENFNLTFDNTTSFKLYAPNFNYENGDMIIIETLNEFNEWTSLPYIFGVDIHVEGSYTESGEIWIYLKNDDGTGFYPASSITVGFRAGLIKKDGLILNPSLKDMTISDILKEK
jgi:hypothetical protein